MNLYLLQYTKVDSRWIRDLHAEDKHKKIIGYYIDYDHFELVEATNFLKKTQIV